MEVNQTVNHEDDKLDFKRILPILVIVLVDLLGLTIIIPLLPLYSASYGADALMVGLISTAYPAMQFIGAPILGSLSDRYGRKPVLIASQIGTFAGFIILGLANSLAVILIARIIDGISGANISAAQAALTDSTTEKNRTQGLGLIGAAFGLGFVIGPIIAFMTLALSNNDYRAPAYVAAAFSLVSIVLTTFWFKETLPAEQRTAARNERKTSLVHRISQALRNPAVGILLILIFGQQLVFFGFENLITLFTLNRLGMNASSNTILFVYVGVLIVMVQGYFIGKWSRKYGERKLIFAGLALMGIGLTLTSLTPHQPVPWYSRSAMVQELTLETAEGAGETLSGDADMAIDLPDDSNTGWFGFVWLLVAMVPTAMGGGMLSPSINSTITKRVPASQVGSMLGVSAALVSGANAISPILGGAAFQTLGSTAPFLIGGVTLGLLFLVALRKIQPETTATSSAVD